MSDAVLLRELILIRHGESHGNVGTAGDEFIDIQDPLLTENGFCQAECLGKMMGEEPDVIYTSGLRRAVLTAEGLSRHRTDDAPVYILPELCEIGVSPDYPGLTLEEIRQLCPKAVMAPGTEENAKTVVGDECTYEHEERYFKRAENVLNYIASQYNNGEKVALVSHAGFLTYVIFYLIGYRDAQPGYDFRLTNTGVSRILFYEPGTNRYGDVIFDCVNERKHLEKY